MTYNIATKCLHLLHLLCAIRVYNLCIYIHRPLNGSCSSHWLIKKRRKDLQRFTNTGVHTCLCSFISPLASYFLLSFSATWRTLVLLSEQMHCDCGPFPPPPPFFTGLRCISCLILQDNFFLGWNSLCLIFLSSCLLCEELPIGALCFCRKAAINAIEESVFPLLLSTFLHYLCLSAAWLWPNDSSFPKQFKLTPSYAVGFEPMQTHMWYGKWKYNSCHLELWKEIRSWLFWLIENILHMFIFLKAWIRLWERIGRECSLPCYFCGCMQVELLNCCYPNSDMSVLERHSLTPLKNTPLAVLFPIADWRACDKVPGTRSISGLWFVLVFLQYWHNTQWESFEGNPVVNTKFIDALELFYLHRLRTILHNTSSAHEVWLYLLCEVKNPSFRWRCRDVGPTVSNSEVFWIFNYPVTDAVGWQLSK